MPKRKKGFTLIELLVVITIIGIVGTFIIVNINDARNRAKAANLVSQFKEIEKAFYYTYLEENRSYFWTEGEIGLGNNPTLNEIIGIESGPLSGFSTYFPHENLTNLFNDGEYDLDNDGDVQDCQFSGSAGVTLSIIVQNEYRIARNVESLVDGDNDLACGKFRYNGARMKWVISDDGSSIEFN
jgi:prepilin-type N-terminal cleavage/methylation domain-containing protein